VNTHNAIKHALDGAAVTTAGLSFFKVIPWAEVAGFLSSVYLLLQLWMFFYHKRWKRRGRRAEDLDG
jgi:hypothetical protein